MLALAEEETSIDLITLREELRHRGKEEVAGGAAYVASLTDGLQRGLNVGHDAKTVREKATARQLIQLSNELMCRRYEGEQRPAQILEGTESRIFQTASREIKGGFQPARELAGAACKGIEEAAKNRRAVVGIDTGFTARRLEDAKVIKREIRRCKGEMQRLENEASASFPELKQTLAAIKS